MTPLRISRVLHAGYVFEFEDVRVLFDPIFENPFSRNCHAFPDVEFDREAIQKLRWDAVFISHYHDDHCSFDSLRVLPRETPIFIYCLHEEMITMIRELGFDKVQALQIGESVHVGKIEIIPHRALDADVDSIFQIKAGGANILNVVDSWIDDETLEKLADAAPWDLILWPFQTMRELEVLSPETATPADGKIPSEWIEQLQKLNPRHLVPSSCQLRMEPWSWYNRAFFPISYGGFADQLREILPQTEVFRLDPGTALIFENGFWRPGPRLSWIHPRGEQDLDYQYDSGAVPQTTADIARHFPALTEEQTSGVLKYCATWILEKYRSLDVDEDGYFSRIRYWKLSLYDEGGRVRDFTYRIHGDEISLSNGREEPSWRTEVPIQRLHSALEEGEALTSMYIRVYPGRNADVLEDPLIRSLFTGVFGSYQKAQLRKIRSE